MVEDQHITSEWLFKDTKIKKKHLSSKINLFYLKMTHIT